ncbi:MAG: sulfatase-like hydrolase/transferase [Faecalibacterium sp.]
MPKEKKQIILFMTDTTRKDMLGCYGWDKMKTPCLDKLATQGIRYNNAYTCQPVSGPARSALFTGTFPHTNGVVANSIPFGANVKTVGQRLTDSSIHCGYIGKWHLDGGDYFGFGQCPEGWDEKYWYDMKCYLSELSDQDKIRSRNPQTSFAPDFTEEFTYAHRCSDRALSFLEEYKNLDDFLLVVSYDEPHGPRLCPAPYNTMYDGVKFPDCPNHQDDLSQKPFMQQLWSGVALHQEIEEINKPTPVLSQFLGCNSFVDYEIGRVLEKIEAEFPDALVIFTSDHGDMYSNHRLQTKNATAYREAANIPLIIKGGETGKVVDEVVSHIDIVPTILEYMNIPIPVLLEGKSLCPQINDTSVKVNDYAYIEFTRYEVDHDGFGGLQMMRAIISENYKLVINLLDTDELYDMKNDPYEMHNLLLDPSHQVARDIHHDALIEQMNRTRDPYRGYQWACRPWRSDKKPSWENDGYTRQRENEEYEPRQLDYDTGLPMKEALRTKDLRKPKQA